MTLTLIKLPLLLQVAITSKFNPGKPRDAKVSVQPDVNAARLVQRLLSGTDAARFSALLRHPGDACHG